MSFEFIPGIPLAPRENTQYIHGLSEYAPSLAQPAPQNMIRYLNHSEQIIARRKTADQIRMAAPVGASLASVRATNWDELRDKADYWLAAHMAHMPVLDGQEGRISTIEIGQEGIAATNAFLEVIPKVLVKCGVEMPEAEPEIRDEITTYTRLSQGFITAWGRVDFSADEPLARALSTYSRVSRRRGNAFVDLHFNHELFMVDDGVKRVGVDPAAKLVTWSGKRLKPIKTDSEMFYGCPALHMIPAIYQGMNAAAYESGLFEQTYFEALDANSDGAASA
jgi:hypothetical protein